MFATGPKWRRHCECASMLVTQPDTSNQPLGLQARSTEEMGIQKKSVRDVQPSTTEFLGKRIPDKKKSFRKNQATCFTFHKGRWSESVPFIKKKRRTGKPWRKWAFKHTEKAVSEPKERTHSVVVAKKLDITQVCQQFQLHQFVQTTE